MLAVSLMDSSAMHALAVAIAEISNHLVSLICLQTEFVRFRKASAERGSQPNTKLFKLVY